MSTNSILKSGLAALAGAATLAVLAVPALAQHHGLRWPDNVHVQVQIGRPPPPVVVVAPPPVYVPAPQYAPPSYQPPPTYQPQPAYEPQPQYAPTYTQPHVVVYKAPVVYARTEHAPRPGFVWVAGHQDVAPCGMRTWTPGHWLQVAPVYHAPRWDGHPGGGKHKYGHHKYKAHKSDWREANGYGHHRDDDG